MRAILIANDGSTGSQAAIDAGLELAAETGAHVTFAYVREPISLLGEPYFQEVLTTQQEAARSALASAKAAGEAAGIATEGESLEGSPAEALIAFARARDVDLIVVGSRGRGAIVGTLLGSTSAALVRSADRPVLVVKQSAGMAVEARA
jgi:nucleotide-binding universal stress UspA family protein